MKVNEILVEGPFSTWVGGTLQNLGKKLGANAGIDINKQTQAAALNQRTETWKKQTKQQYATAGWNMQDPPTYKKALDQWLASQYNAPPVTDFTGAVNDNNVKDYIAKSFAIKSVSQQAPAPPAPTTTTPAPSTILNPSTGRPFP